MFVQKFLKKTRHYFTVCNSIITKVNIIYTPKKLELKYKYMDFNKLFKQRPKPESLIAFQVFMIATSQYTRFIEQILRFPKIYYIFFYGDILSFCVLELFLYPHEMWLAKDFVSVSLCLYLLSPWCRVLLEKLTGLQLVKKFPAFHGTRRFITALTSVRQLSLSWASPIQSIYPHPTS